MALSAAATEFGAALDVLGLEQIHAVRLFGVGPRAIRRWRAGSRGVPYGVILVSRLLTAGIVTVAQIEQIAAPAPVRTNGAESEPLAPLEEASQERRSLRLAVKTPEQAILARATAAALAVFMLEPGSLPLADRRPARFEFLFLRRPMCHAALLRAPSPHGLLATGARRRAEAQQPSRLAAPYRLP
jgi:hypothetical protein